MKLDKMLTPPIKALIILCTGICLSDFAFAAGEMALHLTKGVAEIASENGDTIYIFRTNASVKVVQGGVMDILLVGGGGAGGWNAGGGGGGGGVLYRQGLSVGPGDYDIDVGAGGIPPATYNDKPTDGLPTSAFDLTAPGGGAGGTYNARTGCTGASGGGGACGYIGKVGSWASGGAAQEGWGYDGGASTNTAAHWYQIGGGGGGAGSPGLDGYTDESKNYGGNGGTGVCCRIWGERYYGGGGGGGSTSRVHDDACTGGLGGGGHGGKTVSSKVNAGEDGVDGLGGGGGGGSAYTAGVGAPGGHGGSGIVIVRFRATAKTLPDAGVGTGGDCVWTRKGYSYHTFSNSSAFVLSDDVVCDLLLVGGGGGGGPYAGGGGGGGGVIVISNVCLQAGTYSVNVGAGGLGGDGGTNGKATNGGDTFVSNLASSTNLVAFGGGAGGAQNLAGAIGGSGGGAGPDGYEYHDVTKPGGRGIEGQGFAGGASTNAYHNSWSTQGGGGGGAGGPGADAQQSIGGAGGVGKTVNFTGTPVCYGGGGGAGSAKYGEFAAAGGAGGGGRGGGVKTGAQEVFPGEDGTDYLGGGGGGAGGLTYKWNKGGNGGCGLAIIRYQVKPKGLLLLFR